MEPPFFPCGQGAGGALPALFCHACPNAGDALLFHPFEIPLFTNLLFLPYNKGAAERNPIGTKQEEKTVCRRFPL